MQAKPELEIVVGNWLFLVVLGILSIIAGVLAILNPFPASFVAVKLAGWAFLIIGGLQIIEAFRATGWGGRIWALAIGVVALIAGINLLGEPLAGMVSLTMVLVVLFVVSGIVKLIAAWQIKTSQYRLAVLVSGSRISSARNYHSQQFPCIGCHKPGDPPRRRTHLRRGECSCSRMGKKDRHGLIDLMVQCQNWSSALNTQHSNCMSIDN